MKSLLNVLGYRLTTPEVQEVQNHKVAENLHQASSFEGQSNEYQGFLGTWLLKLSPQYDSTAFPQMNPIHNVVH